MSFVAIGSAETESGKPVTSTILGKVKENFDDHESRIQAIEGGAGVTYPPLIFRVNGPYSHSGAVDGVVKTTTNFPIEITGIRILIDTAGTSGTTEIDVKVKSGGGSFTSVLTTKPSLSYTSGNDALSSNGVVNPTYSTLSAGDILRLDLTSVQTDGRGFVVRIDYTGV